MLHEIEHFVGDGIGDERLVGEIGGVEPALGGEPMAGTHERDALVSKQRAEYHVGMRWLLVVDDRKFRLAALQQRQGIHHEPRDDVELDHEVTVAGWTMLETNPTTYRPGGKDGT